MSDSQLTSCQHCGNISKMGVIGHVNDNQIVTNDDGSSFDYGTTYLVLSCPACKNVNIVSYEWSDHMDENHMFEYVFLFPGSPNYPLGLPEKILTSFKAAEKVKLIDVNAYAILTRRLLELVCLDRGAEGDTLAKMLKDLATKNEIPDKLVKVASGLKDFGNMGAHASIGELSESEIPIVGALCNAIIEYVYTAPYLTTLAERQLKKLKGGGTI